MARTKQETNLKNTLKSIRLNEPTISTILGALVVLVVGILLVNYVRGRMQAPPAITPSTQTTSQEESINLPTTYKVQKGDHLWKISEKYYGSGYNWVDIAKANNLKNPSILVEGQELTIPQAEKAKPTVAFPTTAPVTQAQPTPQTASPAPEQKTTPAPDTTIQGGSYKVVKGDSLWKVAVRAYGDGYKWVDVWHANKIKNPNLIYPDQDLTLPNK